MAHRASAFILCTLACSSAAYAHDAPLPTRPSPAPSATPWHNPTNTRYSIVDACGGPKELINKIDPSPCVLVAGQAQLSFGYANVNTQGSVRISGTKQRGFNLPISGNANVYPLFLLAFGVSPSAQLQITAPSSANVSTRRLGGSSLAMDTTLTYKQLVYANERSFMLAALEAGYTAPTSGSASGPAYYLQAELTQPIDANLSIGGYWTLRNVALTSGSCAWSDPFGVYLAWSPANSSFAFLPLVSHSFSPNRTVVIADVAQLINRHVLINLEYGGLGVSGTATGRFPLPLTFSANANPRVLAATLYFLIGESNLPSMPATH